MRNKQIHTKTFWYIVLTLLLLIVSVISGGLTASAFADTSEYSDVMDDLQKAENFNADDYPSYIGGACVQVIQIAESEHDELFIYVHSPTYYSFKATSINISTTIRDSLKYDNYKLTRLSSSGAFTKYLVEGLEVRKDPLRYYDISSIYRAWDSELDDGPDNNNTVSEVAFPVGQLWTACTVGGEVSYSCESIEVVSVTSQMVALRRYNNGLEWSGIEYCDAHYIAFKCNHDIDKLISADVSFYTQSYEVSNGKGKLGDDKTKHFKTVYSTDKGASKKQVWQRLTSTSEFIADMEITGTEKATLSKYDWIINFYETEYSLNNKWENIFTPVLLVNEILSLVNSDISYLFSVSGTLVSEVTIMRLEFEYAGKIYNLGVVSDKQTGNQLPTNSDNKGANIFDKINGFFDFFVKLWNTVKGFSWWHWLLIAVGVVVTICLIIALIKWGIKAVFSFILWLIVSAFKLLWWLITLPFRGVKALFQKIRGE